MSEVYHRVLSNSSPWVSRSTQIICHRLNFSSIFECIITWIDSSFILDIVSGHQELSCWSRQAQCSFPRALQWKWTARAWWDDHAWRDESQLTFGYLIVMMAQFGALFLAGEDPASLGTWRTLSANRRGGKKNYDGCKRFCFSGTYGNFKILDFMTTFGKLQTVWEFRFRDANFSEEKRFQTVSDRKVFPYCALLELVDGRKYLHQVESRKKHSCKDFCAPLSTRHAFSHYA